MTPMTNPAVIDAPQVDAAQVEVPAIDERARLDNRVPTHESFDTSAYDGLLYTVFQQLRASSGGGIAVALTSANPGEGVSHSIRALVTSLNKDSSARILQMDSRGLRDAVCTPEQLVQCCRPVDAVETPSRYEFVAGLASEYATLGNRRPFAAGQSASQNIPQAGSHANWKTNWEYRRDCIRELRSAFDYILIDCPAITVGGDVFSLAPLIDGVIMVVEAGRTRADQILHAERSIDFARGKLIGHILNKRTFTVPDWLYRRL